MDKIRVLRNYICIRKRTKKTGITSINQIIIKTLELYSDSYGFNIKPQFIISDNAINVILPVVKEGILFGKSKVTEILESMFEKSVVIIDGNSRERKHRIN